MKVEKSAGIKDGKCSVLKGQGQRDAVPIAALKTLDRLGNLNADLPDVHGRLLFTARPLQWWVANIAHFYLQIHMSNQRIT